MSNTSEAKNGIPADPAARRAELTERLHELRRSRGAALADGRKVGDIDKRIEAVERDLAALDDLDAELTRRRQAAAAKAAAARQDDLRRQVAEADAARVEALTDCEKAARAFAEGLTKAHAAYSTLASAISGLNGGNHMSSLAPLEVERRISILWAFAVQPSARATGTRIGALSYSGSTPRGARSWIEAESIFISRAINAALGIEAAPEPETQWEPAPLLDPKVPPSAEEQNS